MIPQQTGKNVYLANGIQTEWPYTFNLLNASDMAVYVTDLDGIDTKVTANYAVDTVGLKVVYPTPASLLPPVVNNFKVTLKRMTPLVQGEDLTNQGAVPAATIEGGLDRAVMMIQDLAEEVSRSIKYPVSSPSAGDAATIIAQLNKSALYAQAYADNAAVSAAQAAISAATAGVTLAGPLEDRPFAPTSDIRWWATDREELSQYIAVAHRWIVLG